MRFTRQKLLLVSIAVVIGITGIISLIAYSNSRRKDTPLIFSKSDTLLELYHNSLINTIEPKTNRTLDKQQQNITTSEGQSYTLLRSVYMDDQKQYDASLQWTKDNLQRDDHLFSWKFGRLPNGQYSILDNIGGQNTATDGDSDIALSLLLAYSRWQQDKYLYDAKAIISSIWDKEVVMINGQPVLSADDLERNNPTQVVLNPSYFSPYAYKLFAKVDPSHDWVGLANNSYRILADVSDDKLNTVSASGLPPDWVIMNRQTGEFSAPSAESGQTTDFGYDAMRVPFRLALDYSWFKDPRAKQVLGKFSLLQREWEQHHQLAAVYGHDGTPKADYEAPPAIYGGTFGYFKVMQPQTSRQIYQAKLATLYDTDGQKWKTELGYYDDNWAWFGIGLSQDALPNLTSEH